MQGIECLNIVENICSVADWGPFLLNEKICKFGKIECTKHIKEQKMYPTKKRKNSQ